MKIPQEIGYPHFYQFSYDIQWVWREKWRVSQELDKVFTNVGEFFI